MRSSRIYLFGSAAMALVLAATASPALAAEPAAAPEAEDPGAAQLKDIVITATRSGETNLQNTPIAVTAFSPQALIDRGVTTALDLNGLAPNVSIGSQSGKGATSGAVTIRGIGVDANPPASPAVGIYVDDVYLPANYGNLIGTYDLAQVEILRGPQGTLFGRNTIGGAIVYTSVKPKIGVLSGYAEGTVGNQAHYDFSGGANIPLADWAALRVSGALTNRDGFVHDLLNNVYRGSEHNSEVRVQLRLEPAAGLLVDLKAEVVHQESNGPSATQTAFNYTSILGGLPFTASGSLDKFISPDFYTVVGANAAESFRSTLKVAQGAISYDIAPNVKIKSISAYSETKDFLQVDADGTPVPLFANTQGNNIAKLFTQEFQLYGKLFAGHLHYTLGVYYFNEAASNTNSCAFFFVSPVCANTTFGSYDVQTKSYAGYGQLTYDITDRLSAIGGLRYTDDKINVVNSLASYPPQNVDYTNTSPLAGLNYQATDDILLYAKWSKGFRAGSFSPNLFGANPFGPETAETYEAGTRMEFFNHRVRVNPTIFLTNWSNVQFNSVQVYLPPAAPTPTPAPIIRNAGNVRSKGFEIETQFAVTKSFTINASGALFEGHYTSLLLTPFGTPVANVTLATPLKRAPKASFSIGGRYEVPVGDSKIALSGTYAWQAHQRSATSDNDNVEIAAYGLLNMRLAYFAPKNLFQVAAFVNNLTNEKYLIGGVNFGNGGLVPTREADVGRPREFGLTLRVNYSR